MYTTIKLIHITCVLLSLGGFFTRGILMIKESPLFHSRLSKIAPHFIDTILLASAIALAFIASQNPLTSNWLGAKIIGLIIYIGLGLWAFRFGRSRKQKIITWALAVIVFLFIIFIAVTKPF